MPDTTSQTQPAPVCRHTLATGRRCGSPCLRGEHFCYYHHTNRRLTRARKPRQPSRSAPKIEKPAVAIVSPSQTSKYVLTTVTNLPALAVGILVGMYLATHLTHIF
jgi:hypothetical protein